MWACMLLSGCDEKRDAPAVSQGSRAAQPESARSASATSEPRRTRAESAASSHSAALASVSGSASGSPSGKASAAPLTSTSSHAKQLPPMMNLGVSAPAVLGNGVMVAKTKKDDLVISRLQKDGFAPITVPQDELSAWPVGLASGSSTHAYWVSRRRLVRRQVKADGSQGPLEVLATDAANAAVSASRSTGATERDVVLYIGSAVSKEGERAARLWVEGQGSRRLSREAGGATSVSVVALGAGRFALVTLDGRVGMSPVHAMSLELDEQGVPHVGEDRVVHVAGPAQRGTALTGVLLGRGPLVLLPISKDARSFGLLMLRVGYGDAPASWVDYAKRVGSRSPCCCHGMRKTDRSVRTSKGGGAGLAPTCWNWVG